MKTALAGIVLAVVAYAVLEIQPVPAQVQNLQTQQSFTQREMLTIREYVETLFIAHQREHVLIDKALEEAKHTTSIGLESVFATKVEIAKLKEFQDRFWGVILGLMFAQSLVTALIIMVVKHRMDNKKSE